MASLLFSLLRRPSPRLSPLSSRSLPTSHLFSTSSTLPPSFSTWTKSGSTSLPLPPIRNSPNPNGMTSPLSFAPSPSHQGPCTKPSLSTFPSAVGIFRVVFLSNLAAESLLKMAELESESAVHRFLFSNFAVFCLNELQDDLKIFKKLMETADLTKPHTWYPFDRPVKRKVRSLASWDPLGVYRYIPACAGWNNTCLLSLMALEIFVYLKSSAPEF